MAQALADLDPTGVLPAVGAAIGLVGTVLRVVPAFKNASNAVKGQAGAKQGPDTLHRAQTSIDAPSSLGVDEEHEKRAYETVNYVLRELGTRICAAGLVNEHALEKALIAATQHVEVNLFSGETNRLFASLAPRLNDPILVNAVFTSIYFLGALTAELSRSLPNYKDSYTALGPWIIQQVFRTAIGEDAFRDNLTANLEAYKTVATTAGLLRPTDIGYSSFPGFPALAPSRYSSKSFGDVRNHKSIYNNLIKHFDKFGFPQPIPLRQGDVGLIKDWHFLAGDSPSRHYDVERADKNIGETFGRVLHWLLCSADRIPAGQAVIAYYRQHIELIKWIGQRMGYSILSGATDLDLSGNHSKLDKNCRMIISTWVILMPSERAQATRRQLSADWSQKNVAINTKIGLASVPLPQAVQQTNSVQQPHNSPGQVTTVASSPQQQARPLQSSPQQPQTPGNWGMPAQVSQSSALPHRVSMAQPPNGAVPQFTTNNLNQTQMYPPPKTIDDRLDDVARDFHSTLAPQCERLLSTPPTDASSRLDEYRRLTHHLETGVISWLDGFPIPEGHPARKRRKDMIMEAQELLQSLDVANRPPSAIITPSIDTTPSAVNPPSVGSTQPTAVFVPKVNNHTTHVTAGSTASTAEKPELPAIASSTQSSSLSPAQQTNLFSPTSPPPYSPNTPPSTVSSPSVVNPVAFTPPAKKPIRRKAPPPPKSVIAAKALYDFEPEEDNDEELAIKEGDDIEIVEKTADLEEEGWCKARIKGEKRIGLVPLEYLEIEEKPLLTKPPTIQPQMASAAPASYPGHHELHGGESQTFYGTTAANDTSNEFSSSHTMYAPSSSQPYDPTNYPASSSSAIYPNSPQIYMANMQQPHHTSKIGKKMEVAGLGVATAGAVAGIATYVQQEQQPDAQPANDAAQQIPPTENITVNEQYDPTQNSQNNYNPTTDMTQTNTDNSTTINNDNTDTTTLQTSPPPNSTDPTSFSPPVIDLSTYSSSPFDTSYPFDPQPQPQVPLATDDSNPIAGLAAVDPYYAAQSPAAATAPDFNGMLAAEGAPPMSTSPFAGMATPAPMPAGVVAPAATVESVQTVQTTTDTTVDDGAGYESWQTETVSEDVGYDGDY